MGVDNSWEKYWEWSLKKQVRVKLRSSSDSGKNKGFDKFNYIKIEFSANGKIKLTIKET